MLRRINISGKDFPILFSMNAIEEIQNRYKNIGELGAKLYDFSETKWLLKLIINEGIAYENYMDGTNKQPVTEQQIGFLVNLGDLENGVVDTIVSAFSDSLGEEKNVTAEQLMEMAEQALKASTLLG